MAGIIKPTAPEMLVDPEKLLGQRGKACLEVTARRAAQARAVRFNMSGLRRTILNRNPCVAALLFADVAERYNDVCIARKMSGRALDNSINLSTVTLTFGCMCQVFCQIT